MSLINQMALLLFCQSVSVIAESDQATPSLERDFRFSSGYVETFFNSNEGLVYFPMGVVQAYSKLFDVATAGFNGIGALDSRLR